MPLPLAPAGTGKSSIVCAMCVGLGGPIKVTERGDKISGCVHDNANENGNKPNEGMVETELFEGSGHSKNLVVRVEFNRQDKEVWYMDGHPTSKKKVREKMSELNIQVDNPLQFLPQDKVGQFSNMSPVELLKETERAIGPATMSKHEELIKQDKTLKEQKHLLAVEQKSLEELEKQNEVLYADVERWNKYQANIQQLAQVEGKKAWLTFDEQHVEYRRVCDEKGEKKQLKKAAEAEKKEMMEKVAPLRNLVKKAKDVVKNHLAEVQMHEKAVTDAIEQVEQLEQAADAAKYGMSQVDKKLAKIVKARDTCQAQLDQTQAEVEVEQRKITASYGPTTEQAKADAANAVATATAEFHARSDDLLNGYDLSHERQRVREAERKLADLGDPVGLKMNLVGKMNPAAAKLARWCSLQDDLGEDRAIGPMLMYLDLPNKDHQKLAEQAFNMRNLSSFLARADDARDKLNLQCKNERLHINIYRNKGTTFRPRANRVSSAELAKFGITAWLDEALVIRDDLRGEILGFLSQQMSVDNYLLGTAKTAKDIDALQQYLASKGCDSVKVLTPDRTYSFGRSRYGNKNVTASSSVPQQPRGLFSVAVNEQEKKQFTAELRTAEAALKEREAARQVVAEEVEKRKSKMDAAMAKKAELNSVFLRLRAMQTRMGTLQKKTETEQAAIDNFNGDEQKAQFRQRLLEAHKGALKLVARMADGSTKVSAAMTRMAGARLAAGAAEALLAERETDTEEIDEKIKQASDDFKRLHEQAKKLAASLVPVLSAAKEKAPELELKPVSGDPKDKDDPKARSAAGQAVWDSLPEGMEEIEDKIAELEAETSANMGDASSVRQYQERCKQIDEIKARVDQAKATVGAQSQRVVDLENEWKPMLNELIKTVDAKFAECFARFRCQGEVRLSDGRKRDEDGEPYGDDDYEQYKIHILVKWRDSEKLHVLGEAGRDSGGERSVTTMVYLISLQDINPAPFRVVDEINQAMDSTNERNIFTCITDACRDGGKQYFLLTPKLLPDLDYGKDTAIQLVFNGPYMERRETFSPEAFV
jgi:chromosome segregation ATPase